jgi:N-acetylglutamate synthase
VRQVIYARSMEDSCLLDQLMANAWPPLETEYLGATRLRWASGFTRRANSCLPVGTDEQIGEIFEAAKAFYTARKADPIFLLSTASAPPSMESELREMGFEATAHTVMQVAQSDRVATPEFRGREWVVETSDEPGDAWFMTYWAVESTRDRNELQRTVCGSILRGSGRATYVSVLESGETIAVGQVVVEGGWAGVQCMATRPLWRRRGAAAVVLGCLAERAVELGAENMYLAVMQSNAGARKLYERVGFSTVHEYCYLARPA